MLDALPSIDLLLGDRDVVEELGTLNVVEIVPVFLLKIRGALREMSAFARRRLDCSRLAVIGWLAIVQLPGVAR